MPTDPGPRPRAKSAIEREMMIQQVSMDLDDAPYRARLYQLFGLIEKEFDALYSENCALRARLAQNEGVAGESAATPDTFSSIPAEVASKSGSRKGMQMGQKLRTALRGPPVFRDSSKFRLIRHFDGHRDGIWHVASDASRNICATASADQTCRVWSLESETCVATYEGHRGSVNCVAFRGETDGTSLVATASGDESTHIWKIPQTEQIEGSSDEEDDAHIDTINWLGGSTEKQKNADNNSLHLRTPIIRLTGHRAPVSCCEWLATGSQQIVTASWDRTANICDVEKGEVVSILSGHESEVNHCSTHPDQRLIATSSKDTTFRLWDFREQIQSVAVFQGHQESVTSVSFTSDYRIVSSSDDASVKIWDLRNMRTSLATIRLSSAANRVAVSKVNGVIAIPMDNRHVRIYDLNGNRLPRMPNRRCHTRMVSCCSWLDENATPNLLTVGFDRMLAAWRVNISTS